VGGQEASDLLHAAQHPRPACRRQAPPSPGHPTGSSRPQITATSSASTNRPKVRNMH
jgi:hypothetical protein